MQEVDVRCEWNAVKRSACVCDLGAVELRAWRLNYVSIEMTYYEMAFNERTRTKEMIKFDINK